MMSYENEVGYYAKCMYLNEVDEAFIKFHKGETLESKYSVFLAMKEQYKDVDFIRFEFSSFVDSNNPSCFRMCKINNTKGIRL